MSGGTGFIHGSIDPRTNLLITTPSDHAYIHAEKAYSVMTTIASIAAGAYYKIGFTTPAYTSKYIHYRPSIISSSANIVRQEIYEDATFTGGDEIIPLNLDRASTNESTVVLRRGVTSSPESAAIVTAKAGGNFANQPEVDSVYIESDAVDITQTCTVFGTTSAALSEITSETISLDSSAAVTTTIDNWHTILGVELSASCAGTITLSETTGSAVITTLTTGVLTKGIETPTSTDGKNMIPLHDADGASVLAVGILGTGTDGLALSTVDVLNGTTEENHLTEAFDTITRVFIGAVASATKVTVSVPNVRISNGIFGIGGGPRSRAGGSGGSEHERILNESTVYVQQFHNIGSSTATSVDVEIFWYEEDE